MSTSAQIVPLDNSPNQNFELTVAIDGGVLSINVVLRYNETAKYWVASFFRLDGTILLDSVPFVTGNVPSSNILRQFAYMKLGSAFVLNASGVQTPDYPNDTDLGTDFVLLWDNTPGT